MWRREKLKDICKVFADGNWIETKDQSEDGIRLVQTGNIKTGSFSDRIDKARFINEDTFKRLNCTEIFEGDLLVSRLPDPVGRACLIPELENRAITAVDCSIIRLKDILLPEFACYFMQSSAYFSEVQKRVTGATRQRISRKNLGEILFPIPPIAEQQRIVAKLDAAFAEIDAAIDLAKQKNENNSVLLNQFLATIKADTVKLDDIVLIKTGKLDANAMVEGGEYPFFTCSKQIYEIDKFAFDCDAVLLAGNNASGDFNVKHYIGKFNAYQRTYVITVKDMSKLRSRYLYFQLIQALAKFKTMSVGTNTKFLKLGMIKDFEIPLPPIAQQDTILEKLQKLEQNLRVLEDSSSSQLSNYFALKSAILAKELQSEAA